jgi:hypothetical protein
MAMKFSELQAEADQLRARCETAEGLNIDLAQQVEAMVQLRCVIIVIIPCMHFTAVFWSVCLHMLSICITICAMKTGRHTHTHTHM